MFIWSSFSVFSWISLVISSFASSMYVSHLAVSRAHCSSSSRSFSLSSSNCRLTVTVSRISRSTMRPNFCIIILSHCSCICLI
ncbi:hypothetical protein NP493_1532g00000 [Ridgeia piscesae]|uniref:Secreted protein n=1 Tax=Ridgeia piscesae TaxID=27915 RepID=A0AAD9K076_RIDPI|nr:hypothetical protein NP493_1532g00000 [Ridgeia piscesae]